MAEWCFLHKTNICSTIFCIFVSPKDLNGRERVEQFKIQTHNRFLKSIFDPAIVEMICILASLKRKPLQSWIKQTLKKDFIHQWKSFCLGQWGFRPQLLLKVANNNCSNFQVKQNCRLADALIQSDSQKLYPSKVDADRNRLTPLLGSKYRKEFWVLVFHKHG